jgi:dihydroorotase
MASYLIKNTTIVNEGKHFQGDILIKNQRIEKIAANITTTEAVIEIDGTNQYVLPGCIDDQVHFREPGLTHKANIYTEAKAAVAGGITSFMEMPNTSPPVFTQKLLEHKYEIAGKTSLGNYSFYMGTSNDNLEEILRTNAKKHEVCGVKIFMGSSTGNLLVDSPLVLESVFEGSELLIATHCEEESIIKANLAKIKSEKAVLAPSDHAIIRNEEACFESSFKAIQFAKKYNSRLHILHITTAKELQLFGNMVALEDKRITAEVCVHHLHFTSDDYAALGNLIKCNPAIKAPHNKAALWEALLDGRLDVIATDHAPHMLEEKGCVRSNHEEWPLIAVGEGLYEKTHAGLPLVQHSLQLMLHYVKEGRITIEKLVEKMSHNVAICFAIKERGFIREGYFADLVMVNLNQPENINKNNILYRCGWSPLEGFTVPASITHTFVSGHLAYQNGVFNESQKGQRLQFDRG